MVSGSVMPMPYSSPRAESGTPLYRPSSVSSSPSPSASRSSCEGSSSTSKATFLIFSRTHCGSWSYPFSTSRSNSFLSIRVWYTRVLMAKGKKIDSIEKLATLVAEGFEELKADMGALRVDNHMLKRDVEGLKDDVSELRVDMREEKRDLSDIKENTEAHGKAIDKDAVTLINHETRIKKLEHAR